MGRRDENSGVDLAHGALGRCRILFLDDAPHLAVATDDATVAMRVVEQHGEEPHFAAGSDQQALQRGGRHQRHVAVQHQRVCVVGQVRQRLHHRVPGAQLRLLQHEVDVTLRLELRSNRLGAVPDDHHDARVGLVLRHDTRGVDHVR